jgi:hypothetical protein
MKPTHKQLLTLGAFAALATTASAAISAGDTLVIDFTKTGAGTTGNWNNIEEADGGTDGWGSGRNGTKLRGAIGRKEARQRGAAGQEFWCETNIPVPTNAAPRRTSQSCYRQEASGEC